jgi:hypothetical protein
MFWSWDSISVRAQLNYELTYFNIYVHKMPPNFSETNPKSKQTSAYSFKTNLLSISELSRFQMKLLSAHVALAIALPFLRLINTQSLSLPSCAAQCPVTYCGTTNNLECSCNDPNDIGECIGFYCREGNEQTMALNAYDEACGTIPVS